jgi:hypothetical protein
MVIWPYTLGQRITAAEACRGGAYSSHGGQEGERERERERLREAKARYSPKDPAPGPYFFQDLKFPGPPKIAPPAGEQALTQEPVGTFSNQAIIPPNTVLE